MILEKLYAADTIASAIRMTTPLALAALGGVFSERGGVVNIGLEGMMLIGAFNSAVVTYYTHNPWLGVLVALLSGLLIALVHALVSVTFKADQIISGVALNLFAVGFTEFSSWLIFHMGGASERVEGLPLWQIPYIRDLPYLQTALSSYSPLVYITAFLILLSHIVIFKTTFGLRLRAVGENPQAADTLGINVYRMRYYGVLISGALAGMGGAFLSLDVHYFVRGMTAGRGYIALAAMIFGKWRPFGAAGACLLFGYAQSVQMNLEGIHLPAQFMQMLPYILTMVVLAGVIGRAVPPASDGKPYEKTEG